MVEEIVSETLVRSPTANENRLAPDLGPPCDSVICFTTADLGRGASSPENQGEDDHNQRSVTKHGCSGEHLQAIFLLPSPPPAQKSDE